MADAARDRAGRTSPAAPPKPGKVPNARGDLPAFAWRTVSRHAQPTMLMTCDERLLLDLDRLSASRRARVLAVLQPAEPGGAIAGDELGVSRLVEDKA